MLLHALTALGFSLLIYWIAPKVRIDPQTRSVNEDILTLSKDVNLFSWNNAELKFQNQIVGPESLTHDPDTGEIYTGTSDGMIWRINKDLTHAHTVIRIGEDHPDCGFEHVGQLCGRVLGLKFLSPDKLIVADAYNGIICVHLNELIKQVLVRPDQNMPTRSLKLFNSVDVSKNGIIYFTVSSMKWALHDTIYSLLEGDSTGRVYSYNLQTRKLDIIATDISFANGITLTHDETGLLVCERFKRRILKINLSSLQEGPKIFIENLPGFPDNIKTADLNNYYMALPTFRSALLLPFLNKHSLLTRFVAWFIPKSVFLQFGSYENQVYKINDQAEIISVINGTFLQNSFVTEAYQVGDKILLGNLVESFVAVL